MAVFEYWRDVDLQKPMTRAELEDTLFYSDRLANVIGVRVFRNGAAVMDLGGTVHGYAMLSDGRTIAVTGTVSGNAASVTLTEECYSVTGPAAIVLQHVSGNTKTTLLAVRVRIANSRTDVVINGGSVVPNLDDLLARISQMDTATAAAQNVADNTLTNFAPLYRTTGTYAVGDYVTNADTGKVYRCIKPIETAEAWNDLHWAAVDMATVANEIATATEQAILTVRSVNLYNKVERTLNKQISTAGVISSSSNYDLSGYIDVSEYVGQTLTAKQYYNGAWGTSVPTRWVFYDSTGTYLTGGTGFQGFTVPQGAAYLRFDMRKAQIATGPEVVVLALTDKFPAEYVPYYEYRNGAMLEDAIAIADGSDGATEVNNLAEFAAACAAGGRIKLGSNIQMAAASESVPGSGKIVISHDLTIYGRGHRIHCANISNPIQILNATVYMYDLEVCYGAGDLINVGRKDTNTETGVVTYNGGALYAKHCHFWHCYNDCAHVGGMGILSLEDCELNCSTGNDGVGAHNYGRLFVRRCKIHDTYDEGVSTHDETYCEVRDCHVYNCGYAITQYSPYASVGRKGAASSYGGIHIGGNHMGVVEGNYSHNNATYGIGLYHLSGTTQYDTVRCYGNLVANNGDVTETANNKGRGGIIVCACHALQLSGNIIRGNRGYGLRFGYDEIVPYQSASCASQGQYVGNYITGNDVDIPTIDEGADGGLIRNGTIYNIVTALEARIAALEN